MDPSDKNIWNTAYDKEYDGMHTLPIWIPISRSEYQKIKHIAANALPTMAISTIKYDENGALKREK